MSEIVTLFLVFSIKYDLIDYYKCYLVGKLSRKLLE